MKKIISLAFVLFIVVGAAVNEVKTASATEFCPNDGNLSGYWASFTPAMRQCVLSYLTYNTTSLGSEESWYLSEPIYQLCNKSTPPLGPTYYYNIGSKAYIPSPDANQTSSAHYYRWQDSSTYGLIGNVNQYGTFGWANLSTTVYSFIDRWKLSDWTNEGLYTKTVDLDSFQINNCP